MAAFDQGGMHMQPGWQTHAEAALQSVTLSCTATKDLMAAFDPGGVQEV